MARPAVILGGALGGGLLWWLMRDASASELPATTLEEATPAPPARSSRGPIPRNGPNGTVLMSDLPREVFTAYCLAYETDYNTAKACETSRQLFAELERIEAQFLARSPEIPGIVEQEYYETILELYNAANDKCRGDIIDARTANRRAIDAWVNALDKLGLESANVWNDRLGAC